MHIVSHRLALLAALFAVLSLPPAGEAAAGKLRRHGLYDVRVAHPVAARAAGARIQGARRRLARRLGRQGVEQVDPRTGSLRALARLDGTLSGPSEEGPVAVAQRYLRDHAAALGLTDADLATLHREGRTTTDGLSVLRWRQVVDGIPTFDSGVSVAVDRFGRVINVTGDPAHGLGLTDITPSISAAAALRVLQSTVGGDRPNGYHASLVDFAGGADDRLAWSLDYKVPGGSLYHAAVDANDGRLLYRANETFSDSSASVFPYYPGAANGGTAGTVNLAPWLVASPTELTGNNASVFSDVNDNDTEDGGEAIPSSGGGNFTYPFTDFTPAAVGGCSSSALCSWNHNTSTSWQTNRKQNGTQVFYFVNTFHDHLAAAPISFTASSGAFEGADKLIAQNDDGAGIQDSNHLDNANMSTPPDGQSPTMQMYLFDHGVDSGVFRDVNGGDDAAVVYHEYTHGLSNRLVVDSGGAGALDAAQAGAMGEAWSDWYAMDYLNDIGLQPDTATVGDVNLGSYTDATANSIRTQPIDCTVGTASANCPGTATAGSGGYTYGDLGEVCDCGSGGAAIPEVHADGEIWGETLWDLRAALITNLGSTTAGSQAAEALITGGMRLSPPEPSFLDARNAILQADTAGTSVTSPGQFHSLIWSVFANRGMGFFAAALDAADTTPVEDFSTPPTGATGTISGRVIDSVTGLPRSVTVGLGGHNTNTSFAEFLGATTASDGTFTVANVPEHTYSSFIVPTTGGYDRAVATNVTVTGGSNTALPTFATRRDWAATSGGATFTHVGTDYSGFGCGPSGAIDQQESTGWSDDKKGLAPFPSITVQLPRAITVSSFEIEPEGVCGDTDNSALASYKIETSPDGTTFTQAATGTFSGTNDGHMNSVAPTAGSAGVQYVRLSLLTSQGTSNFVDIAEFAVYSGASSNVLPSGTLLVSPATSTAGETLTFDATGITDPDSAITAYHWDFNGDGTVDSTTTTPTTTTTISTPGSYTGKVTVDDFVGGNFTATRAFTVNAPPTNTGGGTSGTGGGTDSGGTSGTGGGGGSVTHAKPTIALFGTQPKSSRRIVVACAVACAGTAKLVASRSVAKSLKLKSTTFGSRSFKRAGSFSVTLTKAVLKALRRHHRHSVKLSLRVSAKDADGLTGSLTRTVTLRI